MNYQHIITAKFLSRPNRFIALAETDGKTVKVHVKNTGRLGELLLPGAQIALEASDDPKRKTAFNLIAVRKEGLGWVNIDSQAANTVTREWLKTKPAPFSAVTKIRPEYVFGSSRIDFYMEAPGQKILMEVKSCTLERGGTGYFPDAPTERGIRHLQELAKAAQNGYVCYLAFVIAMPGIEKVLPNVQTHPAFGEALEAAKQQGVRVLYLRCSVQPDSLTVCSAGE